MVSSIVKGQEGNECSQGDRGTKGQMILRRCPSLNILYHLHFIPECLSLTCRRAGADSIGLTE